MRRASVEHRRGSSAAVSDLGAVAGLDQHVAERVHDHRVAGVARPRLAGARRRTTVFSIARARSSVVQWSTLRGPATQAAGTTSTSAPRSTSAPGQLGEAQVVAGHQADRKPADLDDDRLERAGA